MKNLHFSHPRSAMKRTAEREGKSFSFIPSCQTAAAAAVVGDFVFGALLRFAVEK